MKTVLGGISHTLPQCYLDEVRATDELCTQTRYVEFGRQQGVKRIALGPQ